MFGVFIAIWLFCFSTGYGIDDLNLKLYWFRLSYVGIIFIPISFYAFIYHLLGRSRDKIVVIGNYFIGAVFLILNFSPQFPLVIGLHEYPWGYYTNTLSTSHTIFFIYFLALFTSSNIMMALFLFKKRNGANQIQFMRIKYAFTGSVVGSFASIDFLGSYGVNFPPVGFIFMLLYPLIFTYAILKYRFMEVTLAVTRTGIFIIVYSFVLGIPFALAFTAQERLFLLMGDNWWMAPLVTSTILATGGPFIYLYIQRRAEDRLLQEQRRYQSTLRQASSGMSRIKDLRRLVSLIVHIVTRTVRLEYSCVYLFNIAEKRYYLGGSRFNRRKLPLPDNVDMDNVLIKYLNRLKEPVVLDEISQRVRDYHNDELLAVEDSLKRIHAEVAVPSFAEQRLLGILVLGKKTSGKLYSEDDLAVFSILANQAALAIENAQFYEDMKKTHAQLLKTEKMATIGTMADGLSHQINNRLHAMGFIAGDLLDTVQLKKNSTPPPEVKGVLEELEEGLGKIIDNVKRGGEIVEGLLKYTRKGDQGFEDIELDKLINASLEMVQFKIKLGEIEFLREYPKDTPLIRGNFTQLQEVFFNMIDNAYDAMMQRKAEEKDDGYKPQLRVRAERDGPYLNVTVLDNGIGVKDDDEEKLFTPFFTTKFAASKKGTGLGLYVIKKLIEDNHKGKVRFESEYMKGTRFMLQLPLA